MDDACARLLTLRQIKSIANQLSQTLQQTPGVFGSDNEQTAQQLNNQQYHSTF